MTLDSWENFILHGILGFVVAGTFLIGVPVYKKIESIEKKLQLPQHELRIENVRGNSIPEKFYEIAGQKVYLEVDGKPAEHYFPK